MSLSHAWLHVTSSEQDEAAINALLQRIETVMGPHVDHISLGREDGVPSMELTVNEGCIGFARAVQLAALAQEAAGCPVHFSELRPTSMMFFIFNETVRGRAFTNDQVADYGMPVQAWLAAATKEPLSAREDQSGAR